MKRSTGVRSARLATVLALSATVLLGVSGFTFWYGRGYSYLSDDPAACVNCHVMRDNFGGWLASSHRGVTCNECHVPHDLVGKYLAKVEHGFRHSAAFTFGDLDAIQITSKSLHDLQDNCVRCHEPTVRLIVQQDRGSERSCTRCHQGVGHVF